MDKLTKLEYKLADLMDAVKIDNTLEEEVVDAYNEGVEAMANQIEHFIGILKMMKEDEK